MPVLAGVGFRCVVFDDRERFTSPALFPDAAGRITGDFDRIGDFLTVSESDCIVIMTRGHEADYIVLEQALATPAYYIGLIGSRSKMAATREKLGAAGFGETDFARIHNPIGLPILADTPAEIAVSVAAEMILARGPAAQRRMSQPVMIFGAGQAGRACRRLLGPQWDVTAFLDNDRSKSSILGIPVLPPEAACGGAERVVIAVANPQRARSMASQLEDLGYSGEITFFSDYQALFDVRAAAAPPAGGAHGSGRRRRRHRGGGRLPGRFRRRAQRGAAGAGHSISSTPSRAFRRAGGPGPGAGLLRRGRRRFCRHLAPGRPFRPAPTPKPP